MQVLQANYSGPNKSFVLGEENTPPLGPDEILVKIKACAVDVKNEKKYRQLLKDDGKNCPVGTDISGDVVMVGTDVEHLQEGMAVVGIVPLDAKVGGCSELCVLNQFDVVEKPEKISYETAAASVGTGLTAFTAMHYLGHVTAGDTVLVLEGATPKGYFMIQAAQSWGAKVLSTYETHAEKQFLESLKIPVAQTIELAQRTNILPSAVMEETGGVGVDCIIDAGVRMFTYEDDKDLMQERLLQSVPHKNDIIACLGFSGKWITSQPNLQLDPPDSQQLFLRGASLSFLFPPAWTLMKAQHGRFQHILRFIMEGIQNGDFRCNEVQKVALSEASEILLQKTVDSTKSVVVVP